MDAKKVLENTIEMLRAYDSAMDNSVSDQIISNPHEWTRSHIGAYSVYANMILSAKEEIAKKAHGTSAVSALKKIIKEPLRGNVNGIFRAGEKIHVTNGYLGIILNEDIPELPHIENGFRLDDIVNEAKSKSTIDFPVPSFGDLKQFIAEHKRNDRTPYIVHTDEFDIGFNPRFMEIMLSVLPGAKVKCSSKYAPIYFESENGVGVLLPCRI